MLLEPLLNIGLNQNEASIYSLLLEKPHLPASTISRRTGIKRTLVYLVLEGLILKELVQRDDSTKIARFSPTHPRNLEKIIQKRELDVSVAKNSFESIFQQIQQSYEIQTGQPGIRFYSGVDGLKLLYSKVNRDKPSEILLIRSTEVETNKEMNEVVREQIEKQIHLGINVRVITPVLPHLKDIVPKDKERRAERRIIAREVFDTKAQILIWNDNVAITTYREPVFTTLISNSDITDTMKVMFSFIWRKSLVDTDENMKKIFSEE